MDKPETYAPLTPVEESEDISDFDLDAVFDEENSNNNEETENEHCKEKEKEDEPIDKIKSSYQGKPINIILLDGTWNQAKHMFKELTTQYLEHTKFTRRIKV